MCTFAVMKIDRNDIVLSLGSCFSAEMGRRMAASGMEVCCNPFGVLYNPASVASSLLRLADGRPFGPEDVIPRDTNPVREGRPRKAVSPEHRPIAPEGGGYVSFWHHGSFARKSPEEFLNNANSALAEASSSFHKAGTVIITFGTAWVFRHIERDMIVSNCHKHPAWEFRRERLDVEDIVFLWSPILERFSDRHFILTVSPIRHLKDGLHGNQLSKATLLLAEDALVRMYPNAEYFPSYEIILDELRDRIWFESDGAHPTQAAIDVVWERFKSTEQIL